MVKSPFKNQKNWHLIFTYMQYTKTTLALDFDLFAEDRSAALSFKSDIQPLYGPFDFPH